MVGTNSYRNKTLLAGAVGAGVLLAGAGLFLFSHLEEKKKVHRLQRQLDRLDISLSKLYQEILALRNSSFSSSSKSKRSSCTSDNDTEGQYFSANNSSDEEDVFYECTSDAGGQDMRRSSENQRIELFQKVDVLMKGDDGERLKAFLELEKRKDEMEKNVEFLWRFAKAHQMQATVYGAQNNAEKKKYHVLEGLKYATKALSMVDKHADVHKWFAILTGMQADFVSIKQKIENGFLFQKHILIALEMKPNDYSLHHLLGRFKFELANISMLEKRVAATLFSKIPDATYTDAIADLLKAEHLNATPWKENRLLLARCYLGNKEYSVGVEWLTSAKRITSKTEEDAANDLQINLLLKKYQNYLK